MSIGSILSWIVCGLVVGLCARLLMPGRQYMNVPMTSLLGIAGALVGGFFYSLVQGASAEPFTLASINWHGWIIAILGAIFLLWLYPMVYPRKWWD